MVKGGLNMSRERLVISLVVVLVGVCAGLLGVSAFRSDRAVADVALKNTCTVDQAAEILREAWLVKAEDYEMWWKVFAPSALAPYDPDRAIKVAADEKGNVPDEVRFQVVHDLLQSDRVKGLEWGRGQLEKVSNPHISIWILTVMGLAAADTDMALAKEYYERAKQFVGKEGPEPRLQWNGKEDMDYAWLAGFAGRIGSSETGEWVDKLKAVAREKGKNDEQREDILAYRAGFVAKGSPELAAKIAEGLSKRNALQILSEATAEASLQDKDLARKLLAKMESLGESDWADYYHSQAALYVVLALAPSEPKAMLELARSLKDTRYKPLAMGLVAPYLEAGEKSRVLREAADVDIANFNHVPTDLAWFGYLAHDTDPKLAKQLFSEARKQLKESKELRVSDAAWVAYYMRVMDPAESRLMLESLLGQADKANPDRGLDRESIARAMAALDFNRAVEIAREIPESQAVDRSWALRKVASMCLLSPEKRKRGDYLHRMRGEMWMYGGPAPR